MDILGSKCDLVECERMGHVVFELGFVLFTFFKDHDTTLFVHFFGGSFGLFRFLEELLCLCIELGDGLGKFSGFVL